MRAVRAARRRTAVAPRLAEVSAPAVAGPAEVGKPADLAPQWAHSRAPGVPQRRSSPLPGLGESGAHDEDDASEDDDDAFAAPRRAEDDARGLDDVWDMDDVDMADSGADAGGLERSRAGSASDISSLSGASRGSDDDCPAPGNGAELLSNDRGSLLAAVRRREGAGRATRPSLAANGLVAVEEHGSLAAAAAAGNRRAGRAMARALEAMGRRDTRLVTRLLMRGAVRPRDRDSRGMGLIHHAASLGLALLAEGLVRDFGADVNAQTAGGDTALHLAYGGGHRELAFMLERLGADCEAVNAAGFVPLDLRRDV